MFAHLRGTIGKGSPGEVSVDVNGAGYRVAVPVDTWDGLADGEVAMLWISTYVREDRFELFGFADAGTRTLFEELTQISGIGPRTGLELCGVPRGLLLKAIQENDHAPLTSVKGIGKKTAEKLLVELKSLAERHPGLFAADTRELGAKFDQDAVAALAQLGYNQADAVRALEAVPQDLRTTEERVTAALRSL
jgi:Holliday junction DNA helicase RuvA